MNMRHPLRRLGDEAIVNPQAQDDEGQQERDTKHVTPPFLRTAPEETVVADEQ
jgi:hypothetical protein